MKMDANANKAFDKDSMVELYSAESGNRYRILCEDGSDGLGKRWKGRDSGMGSDVRVIDDGLELLYGCRPYRPLTFMRRKNSTMCLVLVGAAIIGLIWLAWWLGKVL